MSIVAIIPARGGSKGIPKKNLAIVAGQPLIGHAIEAAKTAGVFCKVIVSTDDEDIASFSQQAGCQVSRRPSQISGDTALVADAIDYTLSEMSDYVCGEVDNHAFVLLEPTSPLRSPQLIADCVKKLQDPRVTSVATISESDTPASRLWKLASSGQNLIPAIGTIDPWLPRQFHEKTFRLNGLFYGSKIEWFMSRPNKNSVISEDFFPFITSPSISIDIDTELDLSFIRFLMERQVVPHE